MISSQVIQKTLDELRSITRIDLCVMDVDGKVNSTTFPIEDEDFGDISSFVESMADSQVIRGYHFFKIYDGQTVEFILIAKGGNEDTYMIGRVAVAEIQNLIVAYKERFDKSNFIQNLILDNLLLVDVYNRAKKLHIPVEAKRVVILVEIRNEKDQDAIEILMPRVIAGIHNEEVLALFNDRIVYHVNPTGKFVIGGPHGDTGLTGRKIIVDTYGGKGAHGGGAFSGKDPSKVDRSAAYAARHIAKNMVAAGVADEMLVQVSYAIGVARPINIYVNTYGRSNVKLSDGEIAKKIDELFDLRPKAIEERLKLRNPIYEETASYGHMGREPKVVTKTYESMYHEAKTLEVELFTWEKLDYVDKIKEAFGL